ncbi:aspartic peptidase domain-containing protein [Thelonectria olida]|uniref:Aspartic peptidase domain-containing protein n=1 Tax=Thelonectria olida TaxID=1576542 RepID=A0A9P8W3B3_9HYPO|nr:aspartic peptidase domain-containing protein [Thelonectria olida]
MSVLRVAAGLMAAVAMADASTGFPGAKIGDGFMHVPVKRDGRVVETNVSNQIELYSIEIEIGYPPQKTIVSIDTGSSELWVNPNCSSVPTSFGQRARCEKVPLFNVSESSSVEGPGGSQTISYGSLGEELTAVRMDMYEDTVVVGDAELRSQRLGVSTEVKGLPMGIMGLAPSMSGWAINETYPLFLDNMSLQKMINSRAYSIGLGPMGNSTGSLIFGGIDAKKFTGTLAKQHIVKSTDGKARLTIEYESLSISSKDIGSKTFNVADKNVLIDTGNTFSKLEASLVKELWNVTGAKLSESIGWPLVDCKIRKLPGGLTFGFTGTEVTVSFSDLIYEVDNTCVFGILPVEDGGQQILGATFLRSAYAVFDLDNKNIHLAQYEDCGSDVITIGSGESAVPRLKGGCSDYFNSTTTTTATANPSATGTSSLAAATPVHAGTGSIMGASPVAAVIAIAALMGLADGV